MIQAMLSLRLISTIEGFSILSHSLPRDSVNINLYERYNFRWFINLWFYFNDAPPFTPYAKFILSLINPKFRWYPKTLYEPWKSGRNISSTNISSAAEEELMSCGKTVFFESEIARYHDQLAKEYPFISTYIGSNPIIRKFKKIKFSCPKDSKTLKYFKYFFESGIYNYYSKQYIRNQTSPQNRGISKLRKPNIILGSIGNG